MKRFGRSPFIMAAEELFGEELQLWEDLMCNELRSNKELPG